MHHPFRHLNVSFTRLLLATLFVALTSLTTHAAQTAPLNMLVMDPMALPLSCSCVPGTAQRRYDQLGDYLAQQLGRPVQIIFEESLGLGLRRIANNPPNQQAFDIIIGKQSVVDFDSTLTQTKTRLIAQLTDKKGNTDLTGLFMVRTESPFTSLLELANRPIAIGPEEDHEAHGAALDLLNQNIRGAISYKNLGSIDAGVFALIDGEADAAVISNYMTPLLEGCGKIEPGSIRSVGQTQAVPFVGVYVTNIVDSPTENRIRNLLASAKADTSLLIALESRDGFLPVPSINKAASLKPSTSSTWNDWRGPNRAGLSKDLPKSLPAQPRKLWSTPLTGPPVAGPAATGRYVVVPDKDAALQNDIFRCFDAQTGDQLWQLSYEAAAPIDYSNAPRATPVIQDDLVYLLGALGDLHCVELQTGKIIWRLNYYKRFGGEVINWGASAPPLVLGNKLIINPGNPQKGKASIAALDRFTGKTLWQTPGHAAAYAAFISGTFGGVDQIIGYDVASLGGWNPETGQRLWELIPSFGTDFNVTTPINLNGQLLLATENNATRLYNFNDDGSINPTPLTTNEDMAPDSCTPVVYNNRIFANAFGELFCLDAATLKTIWQEPNDMFYEHSNIIAGNGRVLVSTMDGDLLLLDADADKFQPLAHLRPFGPETLDTLSHPAITKNHLYLRSQDALICLELNSPPTEPKP